MLYFFKRPKSLVCLFLEKKVLLVLLQHLILKVIKEFLCLLLISPCYGCLVYFNKHFKGFVMFLHLVYFLS